MWNAWCRWQNNLYIFMAKCYNTSMTQRGAGIVDLDNTRKFTLDEELDHETKRTLKEVHDALAEKGYNPVSQIVGYLLSEDPTYITNHRNARALIRKLDRDEFMQQLVKSFLRERE
jgi:uncharacterized protein (UPF0297 family)